MKSTVPPPSALPPLAAQGRLQLLSLLGVILLLVVVVPVSRWIHGDFSRLALQVLPIAVTLVVLVYTYRGADVARYITLFLSVLGGLALALLSGLLGAWLPTLVGLAYALCGVAIATLPGVQAFLAHQRGAGAGAAP